MKNSAKVPTINNILADYLDCADWGATRKNPKTNRPEPLTADRVRKLLPKIIANDPNHVKFLGKYYIWKFAPDPRERNPDGSIHVGVPRGTIMHRKDD
jgi:hypothetical protein